VLAPLEINECRSAAEGGPRVVAGRVPLDHALSSAFADPVLLVSRRRTGAEAVCGKEPALALAPGVPWSRAARFPMPSGPQGRRAWRAVCLAHTQLAQANLPSPNGREVRRRSNARRQSSPVERS
jgi:hypothetical protein